MWETLRAGSWVTTSRIRAYTLMLLAAYLLAAILLIATAQGPIDAMNRPIGTDFSQVWAAGTSVLDGHPAWPFDPPRHAATQRALFGEETPFFGWHYPPYFLLPAAFLALFPYLTALLVWQATTFAFYLAVVVRVVRHRHALLIAAAFPAVLVNLGHGHNGFLTAALMGAGLLCLERRPVVAGLLFAALAYKPQFALVLPLLLLVGREWSTFAAAAAGVAGMTIVTLALFGAGTWLAFFDSLAFTRGVVLEQGNTGWEKIQSLFAALRMWGLDIGPAYAGQTLLSLAVLAGSAWVWSGPADKRLKYALVPAASILVTPYSLDYDLMILAPGMAFFVSYQLEKGFRPWEATLLALVWMAPLVTRAVAATTFVPLGFLSVLAFFAMVVSRSVRDTRTVGWSDLTAAQRRAWKGRKRFSGGTG